MSKLSNATLTHSQPSMFTRIIWQFAEKPIRKRGKNKSQGKMRINKNASSLYSNLFSQIRYPVLHSNCTKTVAQYSRLCLFHDAEERDGYTLAVKKTALSRAVSLKIEFVQSVSLMHRNFNIDTNRTVLPTTRSLYRYFHVRFRAIGDTVRLVSNTVQFFATFPTAAGRWRHARQIARVARFCGSFFFPAPPPHAQPSLPPSSSRRRSPRAKITPKRTSKWRNIRV